MGKGAEVDLSLVKLPQKALMFPATPEPGKDAVMTAPRIPGTVSKEFRLHADLLGFGIKLRALLKQFDWQAASPGKTSRGSLSWIMRLA